MIDQGSRIRAGRGAINDHIDDAYRAKYQSSPYLSPMIGAGPRSVRYWGDEEAVKAGQPLQRVLAAAGFGADEVQAFEGAAGAGRLDLHGDRHRGWVHFRRALERAFAGETVVFDRAEEILRSGGAVVAAFTGWDAAHKERAAEVLKSHGGQAVRYWGSGRSSVFKATGNLPNNKESMLNKPVRILGIASSLRRESYNRAALRAAAQLIPQDATLDIF